MTKQTSDESVGTATAGTTRRLFLAASGTAALGLLAGCSAVDGVLDGARDRVVGTTSASPAAFYGGATDVSIPEGSVAYRVGDTEVRRVPATVEAEGQTVELEGWSTTTTTRAQNHNSSRSNRTRGVAWADPDDDGDGIPTLGAILDLERALGVYVERCRTAVEGRMADEATTALDGVVDTVTGPLRAELDRCEGDRCRALRASADSHLPRCRTTRAAVNAGEWDEADRVLRQIQDDVAADVEAIRGDLDSDGDGVTDALEELDAYLGGDPVVAEQFVVCLPAASLPGDRESLAAELTPERVVDYFLGERNADGCVDTGAVVVHRDLACRTLLSTRLDERRQKRRAVVAFRDENDVVVTGASPLADDAAPMAFVAGDGSVRTPDGLASWGKEIKIAAASVSSTLVCPALATPADCPCPLPALFYVRRIRHDDQVLLAGGWLVDDGALYEDAATMLVADGPNVVAGVSRSDVEEGGVDLKREGNDTVVRKKPGRTTYGNIVLRGTRPLHYENVSLDSRSVCKADGTSYWAVQSPYRLAAVGGGGDCNDTDEDVRPTSLETALDCPILHLVGADAASNDVKFKAGAELSKAVN